LAFLHIDSLLDNVPEDTAPEDRVRYAHVRKLLMLIQESTEVDQPKWELLPEWAVTTRDDFRELVDVVNKRFGKFATGPFIEAVRDVAPRYGFSVMLHTVGTTAHYITGHALT
jgi:hypothetical protein